MRRPHDACRTVPFTPERILLCRCHHPSYTTQRRMRTLTRLVQGSARRGRGSIICRCRELVFRSVSARAIKRRPERSCRWGARSGARAGHCGSARPRCVHVRRHGWSTRGVGTPVRRRVATARDGWHAVTTFSHHDTSADASSPTAATSTAFDPAASDPVTTCLHWGNAATATHAAACPSVLSAIAAARPTWAIAMWRTWRASSLPVIAGVKMPSATRPLRSAAAVAAMSSSVGGTWRPRASSSYIPTAGASSSSTAGSSAATSSGATSTCAAACTAASVGAATTTAATTAATAAVRAWAMPGRMRSRGGRPARHCRCDVVSACVMDVDVE